MKEFNSAAIFKLNDLISREDFRKIIYVGDDLVRLSFSSRNVAITNLGSVHWYKD